MNGFIYSLHDTLWIFISLGKAWPCLASEYILNPMLPSVEKSKELTFINWAFTVHELNSYEWSTLCLFDVEFIVELE